jgi:hypothetical protein
MMDDEHDDLHLTCVACGTVFTWTRGEQEFFRARELAQPRRCKQCRLKREHVNAGRTRPLRVSYD